MKKERMIIYFLMVLATVNGETNETSTLIKIKHQLGDPTAIDRWNPAWSEPCDWFGVECFNGAVVGLNLPNMNITAPVPSSICELTSLSSLILTNNSITDRFPTSLYNCTRLQHLDISQNYFYGQLPYDIDTLSSLQFLDAGSNSFTGSVPSTVGNMSELRLLRLHSNYFTGTFPKEIGKLKKLRELLLAINAFAESEIPTEFGDLESLEYLWLEKANLVGRIPESFGNLTKIVHLDLAYNNLEGELPNGLLSLPNLTYLYLFRNSLTGELPEKVGSLNLMEIDVSNNNLTGIIPEALGNIKTLETLNLFFNDFTGQIPPSLGFLPNLNAFQIFHNRLSGVLPPEIGLHSPLQKFQVSNNLFTGDLPPNLCARGALTGVIAFSNNLTGKLPLSLAACRTLTTIRLEENRMTGEIPLSVWNSSSMLAIIVNGNSFTGELPSTLGPNLRLVNIKDNKFTGKIPDSVSTWTNLVVLYASNNMISGVIPAGLTELVNVTEIRLDGNNLSGKFPENIVSWKSLTTLNLSRNHLEGKIPESLGSLFVLTYLDLSKNRFSGKIPSRLGNLKIAYLNLSSNELAGEIPLEFDNLAYERSFLDNPGLCAANQKINLPKCLANHENHDSGKLKSSSIIAISVLAVAFAVSLIGCIFAVLRRRYKDKRRKLRETKIWQVTAFQRLDFTVSTVLENLSEMNLIGSGNWGKVYKVPVDQCGGRFVAVKRLWNGRRLDEGVEKEFAAEVEILGTLKHANIVKLLCCLSNEESKLLVYEYLENSSLDRWLHEKKRLHSNWSNLTQPRSLDWRTRLNIAIGAAQGLCHMHHDCRPSVIHRDVKSSNILLDSNFKARIADFGLARMLAKEGGSQTVSTVAGTMGYIAPEYCYTTRVNEKVDVYSFGVVLLELVTGREPCDGRDFSNLAEWMFHRFAEKENVSDCFDPDLKELGNAEEMTRVFKIALLCTNNSPADRPSMKEVLQILQRFTQESKSRDIEVRNLLGGSNSYLSNYKYSNRVINAEFDYTLV